MLWKGWDGKLSLGLGAEVWGGFPVLSHPPFEAVSAGSGGRQYFWRQDKGGTGADRGCMGGPAASWGVFGLFLCAPGLPGLGYSVQ